MADQVRQLTVTCPAATDQASPLVTQWTLPASEPSEVRIRIPPGHAGLTGIALGQGHQQVIPYDDQEFIVGDNEVLTFPLSGFITSGDWQVITFNTDVYDHQFQVLLLLDIASVAPGILPTPQLLESGLPIDSVAGLGGTDVLAPAGDESLDLDLSDLGIDLTIDDTGAGALDDLGLDLTLDDAEQDTSGLRFAPDDSDLASAGEDVSVTDLTAPADDTPELQAPEQAPDAAGSPPVAGYAAQPISGDGSLYNADRGLRYIIRRYRANPGGRSCEYRLYESVLNRGDWGAGAGGPIIIVGTCQP